MQRGELRRRRRRSLLCCLTLAWYAAQADTRSTVHHSGSLTEQAGNPTAPLAQLQATYLYSDVLRNSGDRAYQLLFEPVIPISANKLGPLTQIVRPTVSYLSAPDGRSGFGDLDLQHVFVPEQFSWGTIGYGYTGTLPTAEHRELGQGKYQLGPALTVVSGAGSHWQIGGTLTQSWSVAGKNEREDVSTFSFQPILNYLRGDWYLGIGDFNWTYDFKGREGWTIPLGLQFGRIVRIGQYNYNISTELLWVAQQDGSGPAPERGLKLGFVLLLPE